MDRRGVFIDRPLPIALFERLYLRDEAAPDPLPIVVVYGPGGSGRTRLLDYLYSRAKDPLTCARVRVSPSGGPNSLLELLDAIQEELASDPHPQCGLIAFPRYELGRWMREIAPEVGSHPDAEALRSRLAMLLNRRFRAPGDAGHAAQNIFVVILQWLVELLLPAFLAKPSIIRPLLWGRHRNTGFVWYERHQRDVELPKNRHMGDVIRRVCALVGSGDAEDLAAIDALLVSAFLDDLRAAYDPDETSLGRLRTTHCVALVDDIDLLPDAQGFRLLDLIAERRAPGRHADPLLLVATSQRWWSKPGGPTARPPVVGARESSGRGEADPAATAREVYAAWLDALHRSRDQRTYSPSRLFLPLVLPRLSRWETRRLVQPARRLARESEEVSAEEIFQATHGHPLAVHLVAQALASRRPGAPRLGVRRIMEEPLPPGVLDPGSAESIDDGLLDCFLKPATGRLDRRLLAACALPRALDVPALHALLDLPEDETGRLRAGEVWDELACYAFTEVAGDGRLAFHPLLRDLLVRDLAEDDDHGSPLSYARTHARLADHFAAAARERPEAIVDWAYHDLARGRVRSALNQLRYLVRWDNPGWSEDLLAVARAPVSHHSSGGVRAGLRDWIHRHGDEPLADLLGQARALYSPTSDTPWKVELLEDLDTAVGEVEDGATSARRYARTDRPQRLLRPLERQAGDGPPPEDGHGLIRADEDDPFPCPRRRSHRGLWRVAVVIVLLAPLLAYLGAYRSYSVQTCHPAGPLEVWTVVHDRVVDDGLQVRHAGNGGGGACVGVAEGDEYVYGASTRAVQRRIAEQNAQVRDAAKTGRPYVTVVVMTTLTGDGSDPSKETAAGRGELEGVYLAQQQHNQAGHVPMLRVLVANSGDSAAQAVPVARQIVRAAEHDRSIVAVLGLGYGTGTTLRAVKTLDKAGIPVIASAASSDAFRDASAYFFRVAAANDRQAAVAAAYAKRTLGATTAMVIEDSTDEYSRNLAADFTESFADGEHHMLWPGPLKYSARRPEATNVLSSQVSRACVQEPDLIYYAGRADDANTMLDALTDVSCDPSITIMGGHDLSLLGVPPLPRPLPEIRNPFYYTAMAAPAAWRTGDEPRFFAAYRTYLDDTGALPTREAAVPNAHAALAYDAASVLTGALTRAPDPDEIDRFVVWREIRLTTGAHQIAGVGGIVDFGSDPDGDPQGKAVLLMRVEQYGTARWVGTCGELTADPQASAQPPERIPCPQD